MRTHLLIPILLAACGGPAKPAPQGPGSRGLRATEHLDAAREHDELAHERSMYPDVHQDDGTGRVDQLLVGVPWHRTWDTSEDHERLASIHRSAAAALQAEYEEACGTRPISEVSVSPIVKYGIGGSPTPDGIELYLSNGAGGPEKLLADMRCHRAWMMLAPSDMEACPLDLAGIHVDATGAKDGITVTITVRDRSLVPELQRRAAHDLEAGAKLRGSH